MVVVNDTINLTIAATQTAQNMTVGGNVAENLQLAASEMTSQFNAVTPSMQAAMVQLNETSNLTGVGLDTQSLNLNFAEVTPLNFTSPTYDLSHMWHA